MLIGLNILYSLHRAYDHFGARVDGDQGRFAVWAPHAVQVSVIGDFNGWAHEAAPMDRSEGGVWTAEIEGVGVGRARRRGQSYPGLRRPPFAGFTFACSPVRKTP